MSEKTNDIAKVAGALLLGAAVGAATGILFAPDRRKHQL
jgi:gas vesicle protein